jgi:hypothetical protein
MPSAQLVGPHVVLLEAATFSRLQASENRPSARLEADFDGLRTQ